MSEPAPAEVPVPAADAAPADPNPTEEAKVAEAVEEGPQNALTKKFTEEEKKALKELSSQWTSVVDEVYKDSKESKPEAVILWGVPLDLKDARTSVIFMKFLRARNLNVENAKTMVVNTLKWRIDFKIDELVNEQFPEEVFGKLAYNYGKDKEGRPVTYNIYGGNQDLKAVFGDVDRFIRWRVQFMEKSIALLDFETIDQMVQVHDYEGVGLTSRDANSKKAAKEATTIFQDYYPEFLYKKFFVNVPAIFTWIFWLFKPLMSAQTMAKMSVVGTGPATIGKDMLPIVEKAELPTKYGGEAKGF